MVHIPDNVLYPSYILIVIHFTPSHQLTNNSYLWMHAKILREKH